jgi:hypothetical protein
MQIESAMWHNPAADAPSAFSSWQRDAPSVTLPSRPYLPGFAQNRNFANALA